MARYVLDEAAARKLGEMFRAGSAGSASVASSPVDQFENPHPFRVEWSTAVNNWIIFVPNGCIRYGDNSLHAYGLSEAGHGYGPNWFVLDDSVSYWINLEIAYDSEGEVDPASTYITSGTRHSSDSVLFPIAYVQRDGDGAVKITQYMTSEFVAYNRNGGGGGGGDVPTPPSPDFYWQQVEVVTGSTYDTSHHTFVNHTKKIWVLAPNATADAQVFTAVPHVPHD